MGQSSGGFGIGSLGGGFGERLCFVRNRRLGRLSLPRRGRRGDVAADMPGSEGGGRGDDGVFNDV